MARGGKAGKCLQDSGAEDSGANMNIFADNHQRLPTQFPLAVSLYGHSHHSPPPPSSHLHQHCHAHVVKVEVHLPERREERGGGSYTGALSEVMH